MFVRPMMAAWLAGSMAMALCAQEPPGKPQFSVFGTLGAAVSDSGVVGYRRDTSQFDGTTSHPTGNLDSRFGAQLSAKLADSLLLTLQVVSKFDYKGTFKPVPTWACLAWNPVGNLQLRTGIFSWDTLPNSDFSNVGGTYLWLRPPPDVFGGLSVSRFQGVDVMDSFGLAGTTRVQWRTIFGASVNRLPVDHVGPWDVSGGRIWGAMARVEDGPWQGRAAYSWFRLPVDLPAPLDQIGSMLRQYATTLGAPGLIDAAAVLGTRNTIFQNAQLSGAWETATCQAQAALARNISSSLLFPDDWNGFVSFGYRLGPAVPFILFSRTVSIRPAPPGLGPLESLPAAQDLVRSFDTLVSARGTDQHTLSAGLRWDISAGVDLKFQVDRVQAHNATAGVYLQDPGHPLAWNGRVTVLALALDFIFGGGTPFPARAH